jgi:hypothetical protein
LGQDGKTCIRVAIADEYRLQQIEKNLDEWRKSPLSLLFFRKIRSLTIGDTELRWAHLGPGPVERSEWVALDERSSNPFLLIRSELEPFPPEALEEIRQERTLGEAELADFPPCQVEIVLGAPGRLFVILPTEVEIGLPAALNAPFIQDPARLRIKDPAVSPTNRWLLERGGALVARSLLAWIERSDLPVQERAKAYRLVPGREKEEDSLKSACTQIVQKSFVEGLKNQAFLLDEEGCLLPEGGCVALPAEVAEVWPPINAVTFFDPKGRRPLCRHVSRTDRTKLRLWGFTEEIDKTRVLEVLRDRHLPLPETWRQLWILWNYVAAEITQPWRTPFHRDVRIVPVEGKDVLYSAKEVVRLGDKKLLDAQEDWRFLAEHLPVLHPEWLEFLSEDGRAEADKTEEFRGEVQVARQVLSSLGLAQSSPVNKVVDRVAAEMRAQQNESLADWVRLAHLAAKLDATVEENFRYVTRTGQLRAPEEHVLLDEDGLLEDLLPDSQREMLLHPEYTSSFRSCTREEWRQWVQSGRSRLCLFAPLVRTEKDVTGRKNLESELSRRGSEERALNYPYVTGFFTIEDWDFPEECWQHWCELAAEDEAIWPIVGERLLAQPDSYWQQARSAKVIQWSMRGRGEYLEINHLLPAWILRLREVPCLRDQKGIARKPADVFRRTPQTEALLDVEPFVPISLDTERNRELLDLLGVQSTPTGPEKLLDRIRALARSERPPIQEVERWYQRLDKMFGGCSTADQQMVRDAFRSEKLILTTKGTWATVASVFQRANEEDVPDAPLIHEPVALLSLWPKLGVAERPNADAAIRWLMEFPKGRKLASDEATRVRALLARHAVRIWQECRAWLNLAGEWVALEDLAYSLTMQSLLPWKHFYDWVKKKTADFQPLPVDVTRAEPFSHLPSLAALIEERLEGSPRLYGPPQDWPWLKTVAAGLSRVELDAAAETERVRALARKLLRTRAQPAGGLEVTPFLGSVPAGQPRVVNVLWTENTLYFEANLSPGKLPKLVAEEISKAFDWPDIKDILLYSFDRSPDQVLAYLEENFRLGPPAELPVGDAPVEGDEAGGDGDGQKEWEEMTGGPDELGEELVVSSAQRFEDEDGQAVVGRRRRSSLTSLDLMERFALSQGFRKDGNGHFYHPGGSRIVKANGSIFPWERRDAAGNLVRRYLPISACLDRTPLEIRAEQWMLVNDSPDVCSLILIDLRGAPIEVPGARLLDLFNEEKLKLHPATFRLVLEREP